MIKPIALPALLAAALMSAPATAGSKAACPKTVTDAALKAFPGSTVTKCKAEDKSFEVKLQKKDKSVIELDIAANGDIEQTEEVVPTSTLPAAVTKAFAARYPKATMSRAEKQTKADKSISFEVAFKTDKGKKEATFKEDGTFVEEE